MCFFFFFSSSDIAIIASFLFLSSSDISSLSRYFIIRFISFAYVVNCLRDSRLSETAFAAVCNNANFEKSFALIKSSNSKFLLHKNSIAADIVSSMCSISSSLSIVGSVPLPPTFAV